MKQRIITIKLEEDRWKEFDIYCKEKYRSKSSVFQEFLDKILIGGQNPTELKKEEKKH